MAVALTLALLLSTANTASAATLVRIAGSGSTWSQNALDQWIANVAQYNMRIDYAGNGSSTGRQQFANAVVDFAVSEIPYGMQDGASTDYPPRNRGYAYMPIVAGGTAFMYNLRIGNTQVTNLRLSGEVIAKIFTGGITRWNDPAIAADNPGLNLPATPIRPVVRSDGSGTTAQFTAWMLDQHGDIYRDFCARANRNPCTATSNYPRPAGVNFQASPGSLGVAGYVSSPNAVGSITYVEYSYALNADFPVVKVLNKAGYYVEPTADYVAVALLEAD
ncbi:phosphate ABC transporter substrate-binding protein, partial [Thermobifida cellulosilytica TB100]